MALVASPTQFVQPSITFRDNYARLQNRKKLVEKWKIALKNLPPSVNDGDATELASFFDQLPAGDIKVDKLPDVARFDKVPEAVIPQKEFSVAIIGAGCAGLFAGMTIDWLKSKVPELNITYEIAEAQDGKERIGGRLYTYNFTKPTSESHHDYYDVGGMRFPENPVMARTFELFKLLGMEKVKPPPVTVPELPVPQVPIGSLIDYHFSGVNQPYYYNDIGYVAKTKKDSPWGKGTDLFQMDVDSPGGRIPKACLDEGPGKVLKWVIKPLVDLLVKDIENKQPEGPGWRALMRTDLFSTRDYLMWWQRIGKEMNLDFSVVPQGIREAVEGLDGFNFSTVQWLETFNGGTHWYLQAFSETVLEDLDFDYPSPEDDPALEYSWFCVEGGASELPKNMTKKILTKPTYNQRVSKIALTGPVNEAKMEVTLNDGKLFKGKSFDAVMAATTLGSMQQMDTTKASLNYGQKQAIRTLSYGASCKVGIKFKRPWWIHELGSRNVTEAGLGHTDLPLRTCVYPSYNLHDDPKKPAVLLCSYTWEGDAQRVASLITKNAPNTETRVALEQELKELMLRDLALLHAYDHPDFTYEKLSALLHELYETHYAFDWFSDPLYAGAFAFFGPGQFSGMWPEIIAPSAGGRMIIIGEHASAHHAWVVGALESAVRGVWQILEGWKHKIPGAAEAMEWIEGVNRKGEGPFSPLPLEFSREVGLNQKVLASLAFESAHKAVEKF